MEVEELEVEVDPALHMSKVIKHCLQPLATNTAVGPFAIKKNDTQVKIDTAGKKKRLLERSRSQ